MNPPLSSEPVAVDDPVVEALLDRLVAAVDLLRLRRGDVGEHLEQPLQRVVAVGAAVVDEVEADLALVVGQPVERDDLAGVDDRRVEAGPHALVEEHAVERVAGGGGQSEADVRQTEDGERPGDLRLDPPDRLAVGDDPVIAARADGRVVGDVDLESPTTPESADQLVDLDTLR